MVGDQSKQTVKYSLTCFSEFVASMRKRTWIELIRENVDLSAK